MENIGKIMVAFDLSEYSVKALKYACKLAEEVKKCFVAVPYPCLAFVIKILQAENIEIYEEDLP